MDITIIGKDIQIDSVETLAVKNDNSTETIVFILDQFQNGIDLSLLNPFIIYSNIYGVRSEVLTKKVVEEKIYIEWVLTRAVTCINGRFDFCITFISSDNYADISADVKVWSTNIAHTKISGSLAGEEYAVPEEPLILQLLKIAAGIVEAGNKSEQNARLAQQSADKAAFEAAKTEDLIESLIELIDEINGESVTYIESIDAINGEVI